VKPQLLILAAALLTSGCDVSMTKQPRYDTYAPAGQWSDGSSARALPAHVVAQGDLDRDADASHPPAASPALLSRGRERFDIFCSPCHGLAGDGDGMIVAHGFPRPPSYHDQRLISAPAQHLYDVISNGYGVMYSYAARIEPRDRWAIVAYIRALQLSRRATLAQVPDAKEKLP
jgi:mono/diheme cytochrome c family protein